MSKNTLQTTSQLVADRRAIVDYLNQQLVGPSRGEEENLLKKDIRYAQFEEKEACLNLIF